MVNEVKFDQSDKVANLLISRKNQKNTPTQTLPHVQEEGVSVHIKTFQDMLVSDNSSEENARVLEMKHRIESNSYKVDTDELAKKMFHNIFQHNTTFG